MILIDSVFVCVGGGKILLDYLVDEILEKNVDAFFLLDVRCEGMYPQIPADKCLYIKGAIIERAKFYNAHKNDFKKILCFGNIPPHVKMNAVVYTYFHNVLLLEISSHLPFAIKVSLFIKREVIRYLVKNTDYVIVQSENVKRLFNKHISKFHPERILIYPFYNIPSTQNYDFSTRESVFSYAYVGNGHNYKNHLILLKAWDILVAKGFNFPLHLTVNEFNQEVFQGINDRIAKGYNIINHGITNPYKVYALTKFHVYPSYTESMGLSLLESVYSGCELIAADLPYVHAVVKPYSIFNPDDPASLADAIEKSFSYKEQTQVSAVLIKNEIEGLINILSR